MDFVKIQELKKFGGVNNVDDQDRLFPTVSDDKSYVFPLSIANNVDIDNTYKLHSRDGYSSLVAGGDVHSLWSDGNKCFFVDGSCLYQLMDDFSSKVLIRSDMRSSRVAYAPFNDKVYYTNGYQCGYVRNLVNYSFMDPLRNFKKSLPAGKLIDVFMGCVFTCVDNIMYISDPLCDYYDIRSGFRVFSDPITMIRGIDNGLYVSDTKKTWFIKGKGNDEFERVEVESEPAIPFTDVRTSAESLGYGVSSDVVLWTSRSGICVGDSGGTVKNLTEDTYCLSENGRGAAFIKESGNVKHYINSLY